MHRLIQKTVTLSLALLCCLSANGCQSALTDSPTVSTTTVISKSSLAISSESTPRQTSSSAQPSQPTSTSAKTTTWTTQPTVSTATTTSSTVKQTTVTDKGPVRKPKIIIRKSDRILELWDGDQRYGSYSIGLGFSPIGHKQIEGDGKTPEGEYYVCTRNSNSRFYLSLGVSYPNIKDAEAGLAAGRIDQATVRQIREAIENRLRPPWNTPLGGEIMIHGYGSRSDWTAGCIAVDNEVMDILWKYCPLKTPITIQP